LDTSRARIFQFIESQRISPKFFLEKTGLKKGFIDRSHVNSSASDIYLSKILEVFPELSAEWLLTGKGSMLKDGVSPSSPPEATKKITKVIAKSSNKGIPMIPLDAFAGMGDTYTQGTPLDAIEERYEIPLFKGMKVDFMIQVRGSSMYPKYNSGDVVACRIIEELLFIQWNKPYVIDTISQGVILKRLKKSNDENCVICKSDNSSYDDFNLPKSDIRNIALVVGVVRLE